MAQQSTITFIALTMKTLNVDVTKNCDVTMLDGWGDEKEGCKRVKTVSQEMMSTINELVDDNMQYYFKTWKKCKKTQEGLKMTAPGEQDRMGRRTRCFLVMPFITILLFEFMHIFFNWKDTLRNIP